MNQEHTNLALFKELKALCESSFPKKCEACGRRFESVDAFIKETYAVSKGGSGLKSSLDDKQRSIVELYRNCPCGSTLMDIFSDRRDPSPSGVHGRQLFGQLLQLLESKGLSADRGRQELLKILKGEHSAVLAKMGIIFFLRPKTRKL